MSIRFEEGQKVSYQNGKDTYTGKVVSVPGDGVWIQWDESADFHWAHEHLFTQYTSNMYRNINIVEDK